MMALLPPHQEISSYLIHVNCNRERLKQSNETYRIMNFRWIHDNNDPKTFCKLWLELLNHEIIASSEMRGTSGKLFSFSKQ